MRCVEIVPTPRNMNLALQTRMVYAGPTVGRRRVLWVWTCIHFGAGSGMAAPGISALMECRMLKFLLQTSAFLWLKHQSDYIQNFLACHIQPSQTVQHFSEHPCSTASWYPSILFSPWLVCYYIVWPFPFMCSGQEQIQQVWTKYTQLNTPSFTVASNKNL